MVSRFHVLRVACTLVKMYSRLCFLREMINHCPSGAAAQILLLDSAGSQTVLRLNCFEKFEQCNYFLSFPDLIPDTINTEFRNIDLILELVLPHNLTQTASQELKVLRNKTETQYCGKCL